MTALPQTRYPPPFNITRASHLELLVADLDRSLRFYVEVIGLAVTHRDGGAAWLRGMEESGHHSLVLRTAAEPACTRLGFRVFLEDELEQLAGDLAARGLAPRWIEEEFQGRTLRVADPQGVPLEFCARMPPQPRLLTRFHLYRGGGALRLDHFQLHVPDVRALAGFYTDLGFRISDYFVDQPDDDDPLGLFMYRKNNPHDMVLLTRPGPQLHHFGYIVSESHCLFRALDTAGGIGFAHCFERGPGRHGQGHVFYVYFRDPDGHRVEILPPAIQLMDFDDKPARWHSGNRFTWDLPPPKKWLHQATPFAAVPLREASVEQKFFSLEDFLNAGH